MIPTHKTTGSAGADLVCAKTITIQSNETALVSTGSYVPKGLPSDAALLLIARSSFFIKKGLLLSNGVGLIDRDYGDEIKCVFTNLESEPVTIEAGERVAQLMPIRYVHGVFPVENKDRTGGFGSTNDK